MATLRNVTNCLDLSSSVRRTRTYVDRLVGGLLVHRIAPHEGIWIEPCSAVHTLGMRAAIDVIMLDSNRTVIAVRSAVKPNCPLIAHFRARTIVEMGAGFLSEASVAIGDRLELDDDGRPRAERTEMLQPLKALLIDGNGASIVEYALIISVLVLPIALLLYYSRWFFPWVFNNISSAIASA